MKITVIGGGYVGLTTAVCFASTENINVICLETDSLRVEQLCNGICPIREPELELLLNRSLAEKRIIFTTHPEEAIPDCDLFFIAVGTPETRDGSADLSALRSASEEIGRHLKQDSIVIIKSTIPPGGTGLVRKWILSMCPSEIMVEVVYSPEFLREGSAVKDFLQPERIVIGSDNIVVAQQVVTLYQQCQKNDIPVLFTSPTNAEMIKYASNSFLALKVAFVNELARLCGTIGGEINVVARGMGMDSRIGSKFLRAGPGYGGACLPKDLRGLATFARASGVPLSILEQVDHSNTEHQQWIANVIARELPANAIVAVWGVTFKANTDDIRNSPAISLIKLLSKCENIRFQLYDPTVHTQYLECLSNVDHTCFMYPGETIKDADALVVAVPWSEFRQLSNDSLASIMQGKWVFDLCAGCDGADLARRGVNCWELGKG